MIRRLMQQLEAETTLIVTMMGKNGSLTLATKHGLMRLSPKLSARLGKMARKFIWRFARQHQFCCGLRMHVKGLFCIMAGSNISRRMA